MCVCMYACVCMYVCMCMYVYVCVRACACVRSICPTILFRGVLRIRFHRDVADSYIGCRPDYDVPDVHVITTEETELFC